MAGLYRGYSSFEFQKNKTFELEDIELVKMDLMNHIFTNKGSRVMMPTFGTMIPMMVFEPLDNDTLETIRNEVERVFNYDPRVKIVGIDVVPDYDMHRVLVAAQLNYVQLNVTDMLMFHIEFEE